MTEETVVDRLRAHQKRARNMPVGNLCRDAADEIEKLHGRVAAVIDIYEMKKAECERFAHANKLQAQEIGELRSARDDWHEAFCNITGTSCELTAERDRLKAELIKWGIHGWWDAKTSPVDSQSGPEINP